MLPHSAAGGFGGHPAAHRALVLAAAAGTMLGAGHAVPAVAAAAHAPRLPGAPATDEPDTPQGAKAPLHGPGGVPAKARTPPTTRSEIINRAKEWVAAEVPYSMSAYWSDGYRQDCSGFVSMAWNLGENEWTGSLDNFGVRIPRDELEPGDILLFHNPEDPEKGSHVVIFGGWTDYTQSYYIAYEEARPRARRQATPYAYWSHSDRYLAYRYKGLKAGTGGRGPDSDPKPAATPVTSSGGGQAAASYPGADAFGPGANNADVTRLGRMLLARGAGVFYTLGSGAALVGGGPQGDPGVPAGAGLDRGGRGRAPGPDDLGVPGERQGPGHHRPERRQLGHPRVAGRRRRLARRLRLPRAGDVPPGPSNAYVT